MIPNSTRALRRRCLTLCLVAGLAAGCGSDSTAPGTEDFTGSVLGQVHAPLRTSFGTLTVRVRWGARTYTAAVASDGTFDVPLDEPPDGFGFLMIEPGPTEGVHPGWILLSPGDVDRPGHVVLAPRTWVIGAGEHAGTEVAIDPSLASEARMLPSYWGFYFPFRQDGLLQSIVDNTTWSGQFRTWDPAFFPLPVIIDRAGSDEEWEAQDSTRLWTHIDRLERSLGRDLFRPAAFGEIPILTGSRRPQGGVLFQFDSTDVDTAEPFLGNPEPWTWLLSADATSWSGGAVTRVGFGSSDMSGAVIAVGGREGLEDGTLLMHRLMHVLGAGHGCAWPSVMTFCTSLRAALPTPEDVAYLEVLEHIRNLEFDLRTRWGVLASVFGHRVVARGVDPIPTPDLVYGPARSSMDARTMRSSSGNSAK